MKEFFRTHKSDVFLSALLCIVLGIVCFLYPVEILTTGSRIIAAAFLVVGFFLIIMFLLSRMMAVFGLISGIILVLLGVWIWASPDNFASIIPFVVGIIVLSHGISSLRIAAETSKMHYDKWWSVLLSGILMIVLGVVIMIYAFRVMTLAVQVLGVSLIVDGILNLFVMSGYRAARKSYEDVIDVEGKEL